MPEITGIELAQELLKIRPDLPVILCTGDKTFNSEESKSIGIKDILLKPIALSIQVLLMNLKDLSIR